MARILITTDYLSPGDEVDQFLNQHGYDTEHCPFRGPRNYPEQAKLLEGFDGAILASEPIPAKTLENADRLKVIARSGVGHDSIDVAAATAGNILVCNAPATNHHSVAELTVGLMITVARRLVDVSAAVRTGAWPRLPGRELRGATLGVVGYGPSGRAVAQLGTALGMRVKVSTSHPDESRAVHYATREEVIRSADFLTLHTRGAPSAQKLIDTPQLSSMKNSAVLINTARGSLVNEIALEEALRSGTIAAAALDVFETEPLPSSSPLRKLDNVIITSHLAGQTTEARRRAGLVAAQSVVDVLDGRRPAHPINL